jgi:hypothetical protein
MKGMAASAGRGSTSAATSAAAPHQSATTAEERNLSPALLTSEFHNA